MQQVVRFTNHPLSLALHLMLRGTKIALPVLLLSGQVAQVMAEPIASSHNDVINEQVEKSTLPTITVIANDDKSTSYITKKNSNRKNTTIPKRNTAVSFSSYSSTSR